MIKVESNIPIEQERKPFVSDIDAAWAAGFFDGEGCVVVSTSEKNGITFMSLHVSVSQQDIRPLKKLVDLFGGRLYGIVGEGSQKWKKNPRRINRWCVFNEEGINFLSQIEKYSIVKKEQIQCAITWPHGNWRGSANPVPEWARNKRLEIKYDLIALRDNIRIPMNLRKN